MGNVLAKTQSSTGKCPKSKNWLIIAGIPICQHVKTWNKVSPILFLAYAMEWDVANHFWKIATVWIVPLLRRTVQRLLLPLDRPNLLPLLRRTLLPMPPHFLRRSLLPMLRGRHLLHAYATEPMMRCVIPSKVLILIVEKILIKPWNVVGTVVKFSFRLAEVSINEIKRSLIFLRVRNSVPCKKDERNLPKFEKLQGGVLGRRKLLFLGYCTLRGIIFQTFICDFQRSPYIFLYRRQFRIFYKP